jgi:V/A-type H+-transporting ATPase subunit E
METVETGKEKVKKICEMLRHQTLEPAMEEAERIAAEARMKAEQILEQAQHKVQKMQREAEKEIERRRVLFEASMQQGARQTVETVKQQIEELVVGQLGKTLSNKLSEPEVLASLITALVHAIEKEGIEGDLSVLIPSMVPARTINELLAKQLLDRLKEKSVLIGPMKGGVELKLHKEKITVEMTDEALQEMIGSYIRKDLREFLFGQ